MILASLTLLAFAFGFFQQGSVWVEVPRCTVEGNVPAWSASAGRFQCAAVAGGSAVPAGSILMVRAGNCPAGYSEDSELNGKTVIGTLQANGNVGTTGGNDNITPAGTVAWPANAPTFAGTASNVVVNHVHVQTVNSAATGGLSGYTADTSTNNGVASGYSTANPTGGAANYTPAGILSWPANVPSLTGTQFDNRPAFVRVLFCKKD